MNVSQTSVMRVDVLLILFMHAPIKKTDKVNPQYGVWLRASRTQDVRRQHRNQNLDNPLVDAGELVVAEQPELDGNQGSLIQGKDTADGWNNITNMVIVTKASPQTEAPNRLLMNFPEIDDARE